MSRAWMPMYWGDYLADTHHYTRAEHGGYLLLIAYYWCNGGLPNDEDEIRKIAKCSPLAWSSFKLLMRKHFSESWTHKRIDAELAKVIDKSKIASANAMRRHHPVAADPQSYSHSHSHSHSEKKDKRERATARGARLEKDWWPSIEDCQYAEAHGLVGERLNTETEKFRNYWTAKAGKDATKLDWHATWQNWVLRAGEKPNGHARPQRESLVDIGNRLADRARAAELAAGIGRKDDPIGSD